MTYGSVRIDILCYNNCDLYFIQMNCLLNKWQEKTRLRRRASKFIKHWKVEMSSTLISKTFFFYFASALYCKNITTIKPDCLHVSWSNYQPEMATKSNYFCLNFKEEIFLLFSSSYGLNNRADCALQLWLAISLKDNSECKTS